MTVCEDWYIDGGRSPESEPGARMFGTWWMAEGEARRAGRG